MARKLQSDKWLFLATLALICASVVMVYSASALVALERFQQPVSLRDQADDVGRGGHRGAVDRDAHRLPHLPQRQADLGAARAWSALMLVAVLFSRPINGTRRWFGVGGFGIQPSELAKLAAILFTALMLERRMHRINELQLLAAADRADRRRPGRPDPARARLRHGGLAARRHRRDGVRRRPQLPLSVRRRSLLALPALYVILMQADYRRRRLLAFLDPWADPLGDGFQIIQSLIAVGTGGVFGKGLMAGVQKLFYLPEPHTDFIYAVIAEETGPDRRDRWCCCASA